MPVGLSGCAPAGAPSLPLFGAYFPSWLLCAMIGIFAAILVRVVFVLIGLDDVLPMRLLVYLSLATAIGLLSSQLMFGA